MKKQIQLLDDNTTIVLSRQKKKSLLIIFFSLAFRHQRLSLHKKKTFKEDLLK